MSTPSTVAILAWFQSFGPTEILLLVLLLVVLFGARKLPELGRSLGEGIKNFRGSMKELSNSDDDSEQKK